MTDKQLFTFVREYAIDKMIKMGGGKKLSASKQRKYFYNKYPTPDTDLSTELLEDLINADMNDWYSWKYNAMIATYAYNEDIDNAEKYLQKFIEVMMETCEWTKTMVDKEIVPEQDYIEVCDRCKERVDAMKDIVEKLKPDDDDDNYTFVEVRTFEWGGKRYLINQDKTLYDYDLFYGDGGAVEVGYYDPATDRCVYRMDDDDDGWEEVEGETILLGQ